jgi:hypothetical protein
MHDSTILGSNWWKAVLWARDYTRGREQVRLIRENLRIAQSRQKSYADTWRRLLEFKESDHVYLKVSPIQGMRRFKVKGKLSPSLYWSLLDPKASGISCLSTRITWSSCRYAWCLPRVSTEEVSQGTRGAATYEGSQCLRWSVLYGVSYQETWYFDSCQKE